MEMEILMFVKSTIFTHGKKNPQCTTMHFYVGGVNIDVGFDIELILILMMLSMLMLIIYPD